jgi:hypothetical protein
VGGSPSLRRVGVLGTGLSVNALITWVFDDVLYPKVLDSYGVMPGGIIMTAASLIVCLVTIAWYDWKKTDWLGIEAYKSMMTGVETKRGRWIRFVLLSLVTDPFIVTTYMRLGVNRFNGMTGYDWGVFFGSLLLGNATWICITATSLRAFEGNIETVVVVLTPISLLLPLVPQAVTWVWKNLRKTTS